MTLEEARQLLVELFPGYSVFVSISFVHYNHNVPTLSYDKTEYAVSLISDYVPAMATAPSLEEAMDEVIEKMSNM